jgi:branched-chain amino acid transport system substrate-binding protein
LDTIWFLREKLISLQTPVDGMTGRKEEERRYTRRQAISTAAAAGAVVGVGIVAGLGGYFAGRSTGGGVQTVTQKETVTVGGQTVTVTNTVTRTQPTTVTSTVTAGRTPPRDRIVIGASIGLTGAFAGYGAEQKWALEQLFKKVNSEGGVYMFGYDRKLPVEFIYYDSKSDIPTALANLDKLINVDKVDLLIGETGAHIGYAIAPLVEQSKVPIVGVIVSSEKLYYPPKYRYLFAPLQTARHDVGIYYDFMNNLPADRRPRTIAIWEEVSDLGEDHRIWHETYAKKYGYKIVLHEKYTPGSDFTALITKTKALNPDVVAGVPVPTDAINMVKISKELKFSPKIWAFTRGTAIGAFYQALGADAEYFTASFVWHESLPGSRELVEKYRQETGRVQAFLGIFYASGQIALKSLEWAGVLDKERIRDVLASFKFDTVMGRVSFGPGGNLENPENLLMQWRNGKLEVIWPREKATADFVYPFPTWESR